MTFFSVPWIPCTPFYVFIQSTGKTEAILAGWHPHRNRYLILNFGNVANLDLNMWYVGYVLAEDHF